MRVQDRLCTLHPKHCNPDPEPLPDPTAEASRTGGGAEQERDSSAKGRDHGSGAGLGNGGRVRVFALENQTAPRGRAAPPVPVWERGGPLDPQEALRTPNIWDPPEPGNGEPQGLLERGKPSPCKGAGRQTLEGSG